MGTAKSLNSPYSSTPLSAAPWSASFSPRDTDVDANGKPGKVNYPGMKIPVPDLSKLTSQPPRRLSPEKRKVVEGVLDELLDADIIERSNSPISSPIHLVKQNDRPRMCVDYRSLNSVSVADGSRYQLLVYDL